MENDDGFLGDIKYFIIEPGEFTKRHSGWELLSGQDVNNNSELRRLGITKLPDARGVFLRGMNESRNDGKGDSGEERSLGSWQEDQYKSHRHSISGPATTGNIISGDVNFFYEPVRRSNPIYTNEEGGKETRPKI